MIIQVADITEEAESRAYTEGVDELNARLAKGACEYRLRGPLAVDLEYYRAGSDLLFSGALRGAATATCARCCEDFDLPIENPFRFLLVPKAQAGAGEVELSAEDLTLSFYEGREVDVTPLVYEQVILGLPTRPLCSEACRGLCPQCGANLNAGTCGCAAQAATGRLSMLSDLLRQR